MGHLQDSQEWPAQSGLGHTLYWFELSNWWTLLAQYGYEVSCARSAMNNTRPTQESARPIWHVNRGV